MTVLNVFNLTYLYFSEQASQYVKIKIKMNNYNN